MKKTEGRTMALSNPQPFLGYWGLVVFIAFLGMFIPLSIDMYLPAMPSMALYFQTSVSMINMTLIVFYFFFAVGILWFGPLSDRYGRKPVLIVCLLLYTAGSAAGALSASIEQLIGFRGMQALGTGGVLAVSTALIKDCFQGRMRMKILAIVQSMGVIAPMAAPVAGALILRTAGWRDTFWVLAGIGTAALTAGALLQESRPKEENCGGGPVHAFRALLNAAEDRGFMLFLFTAAMLAAPYMAYVTVSSYIYQNQFGLSAETYSYFFAANSAAAIAGPAVYVYAAVRMKASEFVWACLGISLLSSILLLEMGGLSPWMFLFCFLPFTLTEGAVRPFSTHFLLNQKKEGSGAASSLINAVHTATGCAGMAAGTIPWTDLIYGLGLIMAGASFAALAGWIVFLCGSFSVRGVK